MSRQGRSPTHNPPPSSTERRRKSSSACPPQPPAAIPSGRPHRTGAANKTDLPQSEIALQAAPRRADRSGVEYTFNNGGRDGGALSPVASRRRHRSKRGKRQGTLDGRDLTWVPIRRRTARQRGPGARLRALAVLDSPGLQGSPWRLHTSCSACPNFKGIRCSFSQI